MMYPHHRKRDDATRPCGNPKANSRGAADRRTQDRNHSAFFRHLCIAERIGSYPRSGVEVQRESGQQPAIGAAAKILFARVGRGSCSAARSVRDTIASFTLLNECAIHDCLLVDDGRVLGMHDGGGQRSLRFLTVIQRLAAVLRLGRSGRVRFWTCRVANWTSRATGTTLSRGLRPARHLLTEAPEVTI
jgi:hypothetical protein